MKKLLNWGIMLVLLSFTVGVNATVNKHLRSKVASQGTAVDTSVVITWPFDLGTTGQVATYSTGTAGYFSQDYVSMGSNLFYKDARTSSTDNITYTRFQPVVQDNNPTDNDLISFNIRTKTGLSFTPDSISFDCMRFGTDGGYVDVYWLSSDGTKTMLQTGIKPNRDNNTAGGTHVSVDLTSMSVPASSGDCSLEIYVYALGNTKQAGLANIKVNGHVSGTLISVVTHTFSTTVSPENAGSIVTTPVGSEFDEGTQIILSASRNFGYKFKEWRDVNADTLISTMNPDTITLNADMAVEAVFDSIKTYSLSVNVDGGGKDYMVEANPSPTVVDGKNMYEDGTVVTLTAKNNPILTFTNWNTGETNATKTVTMNQDQNLTASYSAVDYIVGWDFYEPGSSSRPADFYSTSDNETASLVLRTADGTTSSWLDKSIVSANGYSGRGAAVCWKPLADKYYYQISFNAKDFTNIKVAAGLLYHYNAYQVQKCEFSLDDSIFVTLGEDTLTASETWYDKTFALPDSANHADKVYVRWVPDYTSSLVGSDAPNNDGTSISSIYVTANTAIYNPGVPPTLVSSIPADSSNTASTTGKVVLNFDTKVQLADSAIATVGDKSLTGAVSGKTITFDYTGLNYNSDYVFTLSGNSVSDLAGNVLTTPIKIHFTTMNRPEVTKRNFDFVVGVDGDFKAALAAAQAAASSGNRFYIFFPNGQYDIGDDTGDANQMTTISTPKLSIIGQNADSVVVYNHSTQESINSTATMYFTSTSNNNYMQDVSLMNKMDYRSGTLLGRAAALEDKGNKNIYKDVKLMSDQDTYYSGNAIRSYFEDCEIHGTVDFICGGGDIFFNECLIYLEDRSGNNITAPATSTSWGYVFSNCTIDGFPINNGGYTLGRPWQNSPRSVFLNTTMKVLPTAAGWTEMAVVPALFTDYNSMTASGTPVDVSMRKTTYTYNGVSTTVNPYITAEQAAQYTLENVLGGTDSWEPNLYTDQATAPQISGNGDQISWADNNYVLCWGIFRNNKFVKFVTTNSYTIPSDVTNGTYTVRAANEMGGLSAVSNAYAYSVTGVVSPAAQAQIVSQIYYSIQGVKLKTIDGYQGPVIVRTTYSDGKVVTKKILKNNF